MTCFCPECEDGQLYYGKGKWHCTKCHFRLKAPEDINLLREKANEIRHEKGQKRLADMPNQERDALVRGHKNKSRCSYAVGFVCLLVAAFSWAQGQGGQIVLQWLSVGAMLCVFGFKWAYRSWQIESGIVFVQGSFLRFLRNENWLR
jgi:hypothetical protein